MSKFNNTMPQIIKTQCDSGQKSACLMFFRPPLFFTFVWRWWRNQLKTATFTQGARAWVGSGRGWYVFMDSSLKGPVGMVVARSTVWYIHHISLCGILSMNDIVKPWNIWHFTRTFLPAAWRSDLFWLWVVMDTPIEKTNNSHLEFPRKKTTCIQLTNFHTFFSHCDDWDLYVKTWIATIPWHFSDALPQEQHHPLPPKRGRRINSQYHIIYRWKMMTFLLMFWLETHEINIWVWITTSYHLA